MAKNLKDIERSWAAQNQRSSVAPVERTKRLMGWWVFTFFLCGTWVAAWVGLGGELGASLQWLYGVHSSDAPWWLLADKHLHAVVAALVTVWASWGGRLFTPVGSWLGPPVAVVVVIVDEVIQIGQEGRSFELGDPLAGGVGILIAMGVVMALAHRGSAQ